MSEIDDNRDEIIRLQSRSDFRRSHEIPDKLTSVAKLLPMHFNKALPDTFVAKRSRLKFSAKDDPIMVSKQVGDGVPHLLQPLFARGFFTEKRSKEIQVACLLFADYSEEQLFLAVEIGIEGAPRITGVLRNLLRHCAPKPVTQKVCASYGNQSGTSLCSTLLARE